MTKDEAKMHARVRASRLLLDANMRLFEVRDLLDEYTNGCLNREVLAIQERLRDMTAAIERLQ